jgi:hypothetical protein
VKTSTDWTRALRALSLKTPASSHVSEETRTRGSKIRGSPERAFFSSSWLILEAQPAFSTSVFLAFAGTETDVFLLEEIARAGLLGIADAVPEPHRPAHDALSLFVIDHRRRVLSSRKGKARPAGAFPLIIR